MKSYSKTGLLILLLLSHVLSVSAQDKEQHAITDIEIVGHRGASFLAPENTMASVVKAVENGADAVEVDIHMSRDGKIVVIHDSSTKRTTNKDLLVLETNYSELAKLDAGSFKDDEFAGEKIPLLIEILDYLPEHVNIYIEIKATIDILPGLKQLLHNHPKKNQFRIIAFSIETITKAKSMLPSIPCYFLKSSVEVENYSDFVENLKTRNLDGADLHYGTISNELVKELNKNGLECLAWTVNSIEKSKELIEMGVVGITTDKPGYIRKLI